MEKANQRQISARKPMATLLEKHYGRGWRQLLAEEAGTSATTVANWEAGSNGATAGTIFEAAQQLIQSAEDNLKALQDAARH